MAAKYENVHSGDQNTPAVQASSSAAISLCVRRGQFEIFLRFPLAFKFVQNRLMYVDNSFAFWVFKLVFEKIYIKSGLDFGVKKNVRTKSALEGNGFGKWEHTLSSHLPSAPGMGGGYVNRYTPFTFKSHRLHWQRPCYVYPMFSNRRTQQSLKMGSSQDLSSLKIAGAYDRANVPVLIMVIQTWRLHKQLFNDEERIGGFIVQPVLAHWPIESFSNNDGDGEDVVCKKIICILPSNVAAV